MRPFFRKRRAAGDPAPTHERTQAILIAFAAILRHEARAKVLGGAIAYGGISVEEAAREFDLIAPTARPLIRELMSDPEICEWCRRFLAAPGVTGGAEEAFDNFRQELERGAEAIEPPAEKPN